MYQTHAYICIFICSSSSSEIHLVVSDSLWPHELLPGSSVHGIPQARILEWVAIPFSRGSSQPRDWTWVSLIAGRFFTIWATREAPIFICVCMCVCVCVCVCNVCTCACVHAQSLSHVQLFGTPLGSSFHGIFQVRIQEWVAIFYSRGSYWPKDQTCVSWVSCTDRKILYYCTTWKAPSVQMCTHKYQHSHSTSAFLIESWSWLIHRGSIG